VSYDELRPGGCLALDLSTVVGWSYGHLEDDLPAFGNWHLPHVGGEGIRYASFENELATCMDELQPTHLILESPLPLPALNNFRAAAQQFTLRGFCYAEGWRASCAVSEIDPGTVRQALLGRSHFSKGVVKREVVVYVRSLGLKVPDHNSADACMLWLWHRNQVGGIIVNSPRKRRSSSKSGIH
jgi:Holliday junction resolvasome RuvABC endonuclease subunit